MWTKTIAICEFNAALHQDLTVREAIFCRFFIPVSDYKLNFLSIGDSIISIGHLEIEISTIEDQ